MALQDRLFCNPGSQTVPSVRAKASVGCVKTFLHHGKSSCRAGGKWCTVTALKVQCKELGVFSCWLRKMVLGTGLGTKLAVIRGLLEETSNVSGNYSLALDGRCLWSLCAGFCYQEQNTGQGEPCIYSISYGLLTYCELILCRKSKPRLEGTAVQSEEYPKVQVSVNDLGISGSLCQYIKNHHPVFLV